MLPEGRDSDGDDNDVVKKQACPAKAENEPRVNRIQAQTQRNSRSQHVQTALERKQLAVTRKEPHCCSSCLFWKRQVAASNE